MYLYQEEGIVAFRGRIDEQNCYKINKQVHNALLGQGWNKDMIIDLSKLECINTTGIGTLFSIFDYQKQNNNQIAIGGLHPRLKECWDMYFPSSRVRVFDSIDAAIVALSGQSKCPSH